MKYGSTCSSLTASRLSHKAQSLALFYCKRYVVYSLQWLCLKHTHVYVEILLKVFYFHKCLFFAHTWVSFPRTLAVPSSIQSLTLIQQPEIWSSLILILSGLSLRQIFRALSQRGAKGQPLGIFNKSMGVPVIGCSLFPAVSWVGMDLKSPFVYSCLGL